MAVALFGADLSARCDYEKRVIPTIVTRCIEEVELRGIDQEGIYRKSGSHSQVKIVQQGLETDAGTCDLSDPDLDINAVTSALKQYLRKLPNPLITFECYQGVLDGAQMEGTELEDQKYAEISRWVNRLPRSHRDTLEFLIFHLARVMEHGKENLVSPSSPEWIYSGLQDANARTR